MKVVKVWCEWDFTEADQLYANMELARQTMDEAFKENVYAEDMPDLDSVEDVGLVNFEWVEVVGA